MLRLPAARRSLPCPDRRHTGTLREAARRLLALCSALILLVGTLMAGRSYLWCAMMQQTVESCCCEPEPATDGAEARSESAPGVETGCCEHRSSEGATPGSVASDVLELPAAAPVDSGTAPFSISAERASVTTQPIVAQLLRARPIRAGPATASDTCIRLQVFRC